MDRHLGTVPRRPSHHILPASDVASRLRLRSANRHQLIVYRAVDSQSTHGRRAFSIAVPTVWNSLPDELFEIRRVVLTVLSSFFEDNPV